MHHVLDASAMLAYLRGENGALVVDQLLRSPTEICYAHSINLCEVYYDFLRSSDQETAKQAISDLLADGVIERKDLSRQFWQLVGQHKARGRISLADCFCLTLAQQLQTDLFTCDHKEFDPLVHLVFAPSILYDRHFICLQSPGNNSPITYRGACL